MPPAISDDESDDVGVPEMIPAKFGKKAAVETEPEDGEGEDDDEEEAEDEYRVEKILSHDFEKDGTVKYEIKWFGYDADEDLTWEPLENLDGAKDILKTYHAKIGGPPESPARSAKKGGKGKRTASEAFKDSPAPASSSKKKGRKSNGTAEVPADPPTRIMPLGSWDDHVLRVTSIVEEIIPSAKGAKGGEKEKKELTGLLDWNDGGPKTQHKMKVLRQKVPQRLLDYYEQHLVFTTDEDHA
ncbi:hypothetical protein LTR53_005015 [Teratosphaeriaceae sp. CCFEE 6253]|nr:hypothetical protein LTR53_005015 [Teratosphaeriaceae sp. CCFEE 6253]